MHEIPFLEDFVIIVGSAVGVIALSRRLNVPPVVGFLVTGILVGPSGLALVEDIHRVEIFAELGVVFLLFVIGLELSVDRLRRLGRIIAIGGVGQVGLTIAMVSAIAVLLGVETTRSVYFGFLVALSSTAIVLKIYFDRRELDAPHGRLAVGVLVLQDFLIVPMLLVVPVLAGAAGETGRDIVIRFGTGLVVIGLAFVVGRYVLPAFLRVLAGTRVKELFVLGSLFSSLGAALVTETLGFSLALGAFLVGILIAESEFHYQVLAEVAPFRDLFTSMFFISMGMLLDFDVVVQAPLMIAGLALLLMLLKFVVATTALLPVGYPLQTCLIAGLGLAQIGEFSFVLIAEGFEVGLLTEVEYQYAIAAAVISLICTPGLIALAPRISRLVPGRPNKLDGAVQVPETGGHVVIVGYGLNGRHLVRVLKSAGRPFVVLELNSTTVEASKKEGLPIMFGDATRREIMEAVGIGHAEAAVFALSDPGASRTAVTLARSMNPDLHIIVRSRQFVEIEDLQECGADEVIAEEFETSIEILSRVLRKLRVPGNIIRTEARLLRADGYQMLRTPTADLSDKMMAAIGGGTSDTYLVSSGEPADGNSLRQLDLRNKSGATCIAIIRDSRSSTNPEPDFEVRVGDVLVLVGSHAQLDRAFKLLAGLEPDQEF